MQFGPREVAISGLDVELGAARMGEEAIEEAIEEAREGEGTMERDEEMEVEIVRGVRGKQTALAIS